MARSINSSTSGGQVPVNHTTLGNRGGDWTSRGPVSPIGGVKTNTPGDQSKMEEASERPS